MMRVPVNPELVHWARERSGIAWEDLAAKFKKLPEWESGETQPTLKQLEAFARVVHVPVGYLFLTEPPEEPVPISDFRILAGLTTPDISILSEEFLAEVRQMEQKNLALEALKKLLNDEIQSRSRSNVVETRRFSDRLRSDASNRGIVQE